MKRPHQNPHAALEKAEQAGLEAAATLADPGLRAAFQRLQERYLRDFRMTAPSDSAGRDACYYMLRALDAVAGDLASIIANRELAQRTYRRVMRNEEHIQ